MIRQIQRFRPNLGNDDTLLGFSTGEYSYIPEELVPHTVVACLTTNNTCELNFEYPIDEVSESPKMLEMSTKYVVGKYTNKVIKLIIDFKDAKDLVVKIGVAAKLLDSKKFMLTKDSHRKNYDLVMDILEKMAVDFSRNKQLENMI